MNTLGSWIDLETVTGLARDLAPPSPSAWKRSPGTAAQPVTRLSAEDFADEAAFVPAPFVHAGSETGDQNSGVREMLQQIRQRAEASGLLRRDKLTTAPVPPAIPAGEPHLPAQISAEPGDTAALNEPPVRRGVPWFTPPTGPLGTRLRAFIDWLLREVECTDVFVTDNQGQPMTDRDGDQHDVMASAVLLADAARRALRHLPVETDGAVHLDLPGDRKLCIIDVPTAYGSFCLGLIVPEALAARAADRLRRALRRTVEVEPAAAPAPPPRERW